MLTLVQDTSATMESDKIESPRPKETTDVKEESEKVEVGQFVIYFCKLLIKWRKLTSIRSETERNINSNVPGSP